MKKVVHVHSDHKFIYESEKYEGAHFENVLVILDSKNEHNKDYHSIAYFIEPVDDALPQIVRIIDQADFLVVYELDFFKCRIVNEAPKKLKIIWRFFGNELYSRKLHYVLSRSTRHFFVKNILLWKVKSIFKFAFREEKSFHKALKRINTMLCVFKDEYEHLTNLWPNLPKLLPLTIENDFYNSMEVPEKLVKNNTLVIGNSRSYYNNHLEVIDLVHRYNSDGNLKIKFPFNYGEENRYTSKVRERAKVLKGVTVIDTFIPSKEFKTFYYTVDAMVNNSFRQFALGNIFLSLHTGVKVYLNIKNPTFTWLKKEGFYIFSIENLKKDLETGNLKLSIAQTLHNLDVMGKLKAKRTKNDFQLEILNLIEV